jgi:hypothetical protein
MKSSSSEKSTLTSSPPPQASSGVIPKLSNEVLLDPRTTPGTLGRSCNGCRDLESVSPADQIDYVHVKGRSGKHEMSEIHVHGIRRAFDVFFSDYRLTPFTLKMSYTEDSVLYRLVCIYRVSPMREPHRCQGAKQTVPPEPWYDLVPSSPRGELVPREPQIEDYDEVFCDPRPYIPHRINSHTCTVATLETMNIMDLRYAPYKFGWPRLLAMPVKVTTPIDTDAIAYRSQTYTASMKSCTKTCYTQKPPYTSYTSNSCELPESQSYGDSPATESVLKRFKNLDGADLGRAVRRRLDA